MNPSISSGLWTKASCPNGIKADISWVYRPKLRWKTGKLCIGTAKHHANTLSRISFISPGEQGRESGSAARFSNQTQLLPQNALGFDDVFVADQ